MRESDDGQESWFTTGSGKGFFEEVLRGEPVSSVLVNAYQSCLIKKKKKRALINNLPAPTNNYSHHGRF